MRIISKFITFSLVFNIGLITGLIEFNYNDKPILIGSSSINESTCSITFKNNNNNFVIAYHEFNKLNEAWFVHEIKTANIYFNKTTKILRDTKALVLNGTQDSPQLKYETYNLLKPSIVSNIDDGYSLIFEKSNQSIKEYDVKNELFEDYNPTIGFEEFVAETFISGNVCYICIIIYVSWDIDVRIIF